MLGQNGAGVSAGYRGAHTFHRKCAKPQLAPLAILIILKSGFRKTRRGPSNRSLTFDCRMGWKSLWRWFRAGRGTRMATPGAPCRTSLYTTPAACFNKLSSQRKHIFACLNAVSSDTHKYLIHHNSWCEMIYKRFCEKYWNLLILIDPCQTNSQLLKEVVLNFYSRPWLAFWKIPKLPKYFNPVPLPRWYDWRKNWKGNNGGFGI